MSSFLPDMTLGHVGVAMAELQKVDTPEERRKEVDRFLLDFQRNRRAWELCIEGLKASDDVSLRLFAAQTVRQKASRDCIVGSTSHNSSFQKGRDASAEAITAAEYQSLIPPIASLTAAETVRPVRIQLCLTLASLLLRSEGDPTQAAADALTCLQGSLALLEFASQLPEEWSSDGCKVTPARRELGMTALRDSTAAGVLQLLHEEYLKAVNDEQREALLTCFAVWLRAGCVTSNMLMVSPLLESVGAAVVRPDLTGIAAEVITAAVSVAGSTHPLTPLLAPLMVALNNATITLADGDEDGRVCCEALVGPLVAIAESCVQAICGGVCQEVQLVLTTMLECGMHQVQARVPACLPACTAQALNSGACAGRYDPLHGVLVNTARG